MKRTESMVNVAPSSDEGHFIKGAKQVVNLDDVTETFHVKGSSKLVTKNHTTIEREKSCIVTCQVVYNSRLKQLERAKD